MRSIRIKPHHFVDIVSAVGEGRNISNPHPYGHDLHRIADKVCSNRYAILQIELGADEICEPCSHNIAGVCDDEIDISYRPQAPPLKNEWNMLIDRRWCSVLRLKQGYRLSVEEFCALLSRLDESTIERIYREIPRQMTSAKVRNLRLGIDLLAWK
jgi:hypothetical protein